MDLNGSNGESIPLPAAAVIISLSSANLRVSFIAFVVCSPAMERLIIAQVLFLLCLCLTAHTRPCIREDSEAKSHNQVFQQKTR